MDDRLLDFDSLFDAPDGALAGSSADLLATTLFPAPGESAFAPPDAVAAVAARVRAIAYTQPLHALEANKVRLGGEAWSRLNMLELAFHAIDTVALSMELDSGALPEEAVASVAALARAQVPDLEDPVRVGERVLEGLISGRGGADVDGHQGTYGGWGPDGYVARRFDYALLTEHYDENGETYLRVTDPAITVLMGALELDVESAQIAAELRLKELVKRGLFTAAVREAETARYRSIRYMEQLRRQLSAARLEAADDALASVDALVEQAVSHVLDRYKAERWIIGNVTRTRDLAEDPVVVRRANQLIERLSDCQRRHQALQTQLVGARGRFREQHSAQLALAPASAARVDLERQLLRPLLETAIERADTVFDTLFRRSSAPEPVALADLDDLVEQLCAAPSGPVGLSEEIGESDLVVLERPSRFGEEAWEAVSTLLAEVHGPVRLSKLAARFEEAPGAAHLLALRIMHAFDPRAGSRPPAGARFLVAAADGARFATGGLEGDDLLIALARSRPAGAGGGLPA